MAIRKLPSGRYTVEFEQSGRRVYRRLYPGATRSQAEALERKLRSDLFTTERLGEKPEITLEDAIQRWLEDRLPHLKDRQNPALNAAHLGPFVVGKSLREAPEAAREAVKAWSSLSPSTINRRLCVLKAAAKYAWKQGWINENVSGRISLLREKGGREVYLTKAQVFRLVSLAPSANVGAAIMIAAFTGLRASELLALDSVLERRNSLIIANTKTAKTRNVPIVGILRPYLQHLPLGLSYRQLIGQFWVARKKAGLEHVRWHDLRHTTASLLINAGVDLYVVGKILGHSSPATTARYAHLADKTLRAAMRKIG